MLVVLVTPIAWLLSEQQHRVWLRMSLGLAAILITSMATFFVVMLDRTFSYNAWYGAASHQLIDATVSGIERGRTEKVLTELKRLREEYHPTYENRARYDVLVQDAVSRMSLQE